MTVIVTVTLIVDIIRKELIKSMKRKDVVTKLTALSLSVILLFTGCQNSRFDRFSQDKSSTSSQTETLAESTTGETKTEAETTTGQEPETSTNQNGDKNSKDATFTDSQKEIQDEFDNFLTEIYVESMSYSQVSTNFDLKDPEYYGITEYDSIWGDYSLEDYENSYSDDEELLNELLEYDYTALTYDQQLTYDTMKAYLENCMVIDEYFYFSEALSPTSGLQFNLPLLLSEYSIYDEQDIKDYIEAVKSCDEYIDSLITFQKWRAENGYAMTDNAIDDVIQQCKDILSASEPAFISVINETIDGCDFLTTEAKDNYKEQIKQAATENFVPAIEALISALTEIKGSRSVEGGLCNYPGGTEYYESLVRLNTGSDKTVEELIEVLEDDIYNSITTISMLMSSNPDLATAMYGELTYAESDPDKILSYLTDMLESDFPTPACTDYSLKDVAKSMESSSSPAFYLIPQYDNYTRNIIYVNGSEEYADMDLFPILAHEGLPGHMYQNNYFLSLNPHPIRTLFHFGGYAEGWAQYVEYYSYEWSGLDSDIATALCTDDSFGFALYSRVDIGINYEGWTLEDVSSFLTGYGIDSSYAQELYDLFINDPAVYLQYYFGRLEIVELCEEAESLLGSDFEIKDFHQFILETGPTYYDIIQDRMYMWANEY